MVPELIDIEVTNQNFITLKKAVDKLFETEKYSKASASFMEAFEEAGSSAIEGNVVCQDFLAFLYKKGYQKLIPENYSLYMKWEILAAANGNCTAIDKLLVFFNYALNSIYENPNYNQIIQRNEIDDLDANYVFCKLLAEGIVDELKIDPKELVKITKTEEYSLASLRIFREALDKALPKVVDYLIS